jgi:hypothetical protein
MTTALRPTASMNDATSAVKSPTPYPETGRSSVAVTALGHREGVDRLRQMSEYDLEGAPRVGKGVEEHDRDPGRVALLHIGQVEAIRKLDPLDVGCHVEASRARAHNRTASSPRSQRHGAQWNPASLAAPAPPTSGTPGQPCRIPTDPEAIERSGYPRSGRQAGAGTVDAPGGGPSEIRVAYKWRVRHCRSD